MMPNGEDEKQFVLDVKRIACAKHAKFNVYDFGDTIYLLENSFCIYSTISMTSKWDTVY